MRLGWNRAEDGVITVYAHTSDGRVADVADFWLKPMMERFGADRATALEFQQQFAEMLVNAHNRIFTLPLGVPGGFATQVPPDTLDRRDREMPNPNAQGDDNI